MKKLLAVLLVGLFAMAFAVATETTLDDDSVAMDYTDSLIVEYCISENDVPQNVGVQVDTVCKELNGLVGCTAGDEFNPAGFTAVPVEATTGDDGCVDIQLTTDLEEGDGGVFRYTVNGYIGETKIDASENGLVQVPEFGVIAGVAVLALAGAFIYKKRN